MIPILFGVQNLNCKINAPQRSKEDVQNIMEVIILRYTGQNLEDMGLAYSSASIPRRTNLLVKSLIRYTILYPEQIC